ncbi:transcriptional regulator with XRE-family HTH domain [Nocardiopsis algeriensis]|uniref:Transcriptional regulator with XRE-family HTH domain n=1 Tax=Nocardiopsis algeriensis TaxID=1478215 RepID=A0A841IV39_9ACTN|nr:transcriptional regulator with XRE-family HTH domain [Nocardiopsis algeriensis]
MARELRRLRESQGLKLSAAAKAASVPQSTLSNIEGADARRIKARDIDALADLYKTPPEVRAALHELARESKEQGWWSSYKDVFGTNAIPDFEAEASMIRTYQCQVIPGLLQTPRYSEAVFRGGRAYSDDEVRRNVDARLQRQHVLGRYQAPHFWAVIDEAALRRRLEDPEIMREQLHHLLDMATRRNVDIQVLPFDAGMHAGLSGSFVLLDFPDPADPCIAYTETATASLFIQDPDDVQRYVTIFSHLNSAALQASRTTRFIQQILEQEEGS